MKKKDKIRKIIIYCLTVIFLMGSFQEKVPSREALLILSEEKTVLTSFSENMRLVDCKKEENENESSWPGKEENRQSQNSEQLLYYLTMGELLILLGIFLSGKREIERFSRKYLRRMIYVIRYMQDMDGRKKHHFCYK